MKRTFMYQRVIIILAVMLISCLQLNEAFAQRRNQDVKKDKRMYWYRVSLYAELLGKSIVYSINLEYRFKKLMPRFAINAGFGYYNLKPGQWPNKNYGSRYFKGIPMGGSFLLGNKGNFLELGAGYTLLVKNFKFYNLKEEYDSLGLYYGIFGYRFYGPKGYLFRIYYAPYYSKICGWEPFFFGISAGYIFGNRKKNEKLLL